jgi:hypothetical protein
MYPTWSDTSCPLFLQAELGPHDQANIVHLDKYEEMVWVGTQRGRVMSYLVDFSNESEVYRSYSKYTVNERVLQILSRPEGICSLSKSTISFHSRGGVSSELFSKKTVQRMANHGSFSAIDSFPHHQVHVAIGSSSAKTLFYADVMKGELTTFFDLPHCVSKIHCGNEFSSGPALIAVGGTNGQISFVEGRSSRIAHSVTAHPHEVTSIASSGNYVFSTGKRDGWARAVTQGSPQSMVADVFLKVFDVRFLKHAVPISVPSGAMGVLGGYRTDLGTYTPSSACVLLLTPGGVWEQAELFPGATQLRNCEYFQAECYPPHSPDLANGVVDWSGTSLMTSLLDSAGVVHLWTHKSVLEDGLTVPRINIESLNNFIPPVAGTPVMPSFSRILDPTNAETFFDELPTRVYSDTVREGTWHSWAEEDREEDHFLNSEDSHPIRPSVPVLSEIVSSKKEWDKSISYCENTHGFGLNSLVQIARKRMTTIAAPSSPQRPYLPPRDLPRLDEELVGPIPFRWKFTPVDHSVNHSLFPFNLYNKCGRCGLENGHMDILNPLIQTMYYSSVLRAVLKTHTCDRPECLSCEFGFLFHIMDQARFSRNKITQPTRLSRCVKKLVGTGGLVELWGSIVAQLEKELEPGNVVSSQLASPIEFGDKMRRIPSPVKRILPVIFTPTDRVIPQSIYVHQTSGEISTARTNDTFVEYSLVTVIARISAGDQLVTPRGKPAAHHVAITVVPDDMNTETRSRVNSWADDGEKKNSEWVLFNDFVVTSSSISEATEITSWKQPVMGFYAHAVTETHMGGENVVPLEIFQTDKNLAKSAGKCEFIPLSDTEINALPLTVALDTEFISIGLGDIEIREDGSREVGRPGDMTVGRVSVIRCDESSPNDSVPILDHYIAMDESEIKDYVTRFSGLKPGDLDMNTSTHWLTTSKCVYQKLRFLVDAGCVFIGHGLHTDFRILNLFVPAGNIIDTVELFHIPGQRFLSLKYLASKLLNKSIQGGDVHCSIEDARTAMDLYRVYLKLVEEGRLEATVKSLYDTGRVRGWK